LDSFIIAGAVLMLLIHICTVVKKLQSTTLMVLMATNFQCGYGGAEIGDGRKIKEVPPRDAK